MKYPGLDDYNAALQAHRHCLVDPVLANGTVRTTGLGGPFAVSGGFALTYTVQAGSHKYAVRCFKQEVPDLGVRYGAISAKLHQINLPYFVAFEYQPRGIRVNCGEFPIVKMEWASGKTLGEFVNDNVSNGAALRNLVASLARLSRDLAAAGIAHGDIQTGNLMVDDDGRKITLIDYDGMYVDDIRNLVSEELGHINFQHPSREKGGENPFNPEMDRFSLIALTVALQALAWRPDLWILTHSDQDAILFHKSDYQDPWSSEAFKALWESPASPVADTARSFASICTGRLSAVPSLEEFSRPRVTVAPIVGVRPTVARAIPYQSQYSVLSATDYAACSQNVGQKVEVIGCVLNQRNGRTKHDKPYLFLNFSKDYKGEHFKVTIWSEGLEALGPDGSARSWVGSWIAVVGLMDPPYTGRNYTNVSISVTTKLQISVISKNEARWRLGLDTLNQTPNTAAAAEDSWYRNNVAGTVERTVEDTSEGGTGHAAWNAHAVNTNEVPPAPPGSVAGKNYAALAKMRGQVPANAPASAPQRPPPSPPPPAAFQARNLEALDRVRNLSNTPTAGPSTSRARSGAPTSLPPASPPPTSPPPTSPPPARQSVGARVAQSVRDLAATVRTFFR